MARCGFKLGQTVMTGGVSDRIADDTEFAKFVSNSLARHATCDWGDLDEEDRKQNNWALEHGERLFSVYEPAKVGQPRLPKIWIITERDRSATTILFPEEY